LRVRRRPTRHRAAVGQTWPLDGRTM